MDGDAKIASPSSTGSAGPIFEQQVDAFFLAMLLLRGIPPILLDCQLEEVHLQAGHAGWSTDDLLLVGSSRPDRIRRAAIQVKKTFTVSASDSECRKTFAALWKDYSGDVFVRDRDCLAILTQLGTTTLLGTFRGLLDCARASTGVADFERRQYLSAPARKHLAAVRSIITEASDDHPPDPEQFWRFLRALYVVSLDLGTPTGLAEANVRTLLAQSAAGPNQTAAADATWNELLALAGSGMPVAKSYRYVDLPQHLRERHPRGVSLTPLRAVLQHSAVTLEGIRTTIGSGTSIDRHSVVTALLEALQTHRVVIVTGSAGSGKSAVAKHAMAHLHREVCCLAFRAEEFAQPHLDQAFQAMQVGASATDLFAILATQGQTTVLVESVERLLEASVRDAFADLLRRARNDASIRLLLTCRDYQLETVQASLLAHSALPTSVQLIPPLSDEELKQVLKDEPRLGVPLGNPRLKTILRLPYLLDVAARLDWTSHARLPETERDFRDKCWIEVVRHDSVRSHGLPRKRDRVFLQLALRRARALTPFVPCEDLDAEALDALRADNLITESPSGGMAAPAHDVLEDWAVMRWLSGQFEAHQRQARPLASDVAGYPALRRGYRKWLGELFEVDNATADAFLLTVLADPILPPYFRDDTLVAVLLSSAAQHFLLRQRDALLADQGALFLRIIHLLRVACREPHPAFADTPELSRQWLVPKGDAWPTVLSIVRETLAELLPRHHGLLLGLLEDWARQVTPETPAPPGIEAAGVIAFALLPSAEGYVPEDIQQRLFSVIARIPRANPEAFVDLLRRGQGRPREDRTAWEFADFLLTGMESAYACRDLPEETASLLMAHYCLSEEDLKDRHPMHFSLSIEPHFGIRDHSNLDLFPASALRGPFAFLLRYHPAAGVQLIEDLLNHAGRWYGEQLWPDRPLEPAWRISLAVPGEKAIEQWGNDRLWCIYRATSVAPAVLESALMALEQWLLAQSQVDGFDLEAWLLHLLRQSNNVAVTAVVASVSIAHPKQCGRAGAALLSSRDLIDLDRIRMVKDKGGGVIDSFPTRDFETELYQDERKRSRALPHRGQDLETLAVNLQLTRHRQDVWEVLDGHRRALPAVEHQSDDDRFWRLVLHRIDVRRFEAVEVPSSAPPESRSKDKDAGARYYQPGPVEEDVQNLLDEQAPRHEQQQADMALFYWGLAMWGPEATSARPDEWLEKLRMARGRADQTPPPDSFTRGGPGFVAAVCVRDHWEELAENDRRWCIETMLAEVGMHARAQAPQVRLARNPLSPDRPAAYLLAFLAKVIAADGALLTRVRGALAEALLHPVEEVQVYAAEGVGNYLRDEWRDMALECAGMVAKHAGLVLQRWRKNQRRPYSEQQSVDQMLSADVLDLRSEFTSGAIQGVAEVEKVRLSDWPGRAAARRILAMLTAAQDAATARSFHRRVLEALVMEWNIDRRQRGMSERRDFEFEGEASRRVSQFVLRLEPAAALRIAEPLVAAVSDHPHETARFVENLIEAEDRATGPTAFWELWQRFAEQIRQAPWLTNIDSSHWGSDLLRAICLNVPWKKGLRRWRRLDGAGAHLDAFVREAPVSSVLVGAYVQMLHDVGEASLPEGFLTVQALMRRGKAEALLSPPNTVYYLEALLGRYVYGQPLALKRAAPIREAVIEILDTLVSAGSSAAFRMRDDFVTPIAAGA